MTETVALIVLYTTTCIPGGCPCSTDCLCQWHNLTLYGQSNKEGCTIYNSNMVHRIRAEEGRKETEHMREEERGKGEQGEGYGEAQLADVLIWSWRWSWRVRGGGMSEEGIIVAMLGPRVGNEEGWQWSWVGRGGRTFGADGWSLEKTRCAVYFTIYPIMVASASSFWPSFGHLVLPGFIANSQSLHGHISLFLDSYPPFPFSVPNPVVPGRRTKPVHGI